VGALMLQNSFCVSPAETAQTIHARLPGMAHSGPGGRLPSPAPGGPQAVALAVGTLFGGLPETSLEIGDLLVEVRSRPPASTSLEVPHPFGIADDLSVVDGDAVPLAELAALIGISQGCAGVVAVAIDEQQ
jgi:hypothetical protein